MASATPLAPIASAAAPAELAAPDPCNPRCSSPPGGPQTVVVGELTLLGARCSAPDGSALGPSATVLVRIVERRGAAAAR